MKNRHEMSRKHREAGGRNDAEADVKTKPMRYTADSKVNGEAEERKRGGRAKKKHVGAVAGECAKPRMDKAPRKNGGRVGADKSPFSSARHGTPPKGHSVEAETE